MPRVGFAFRPFNDDKTAIRAGFGMFNITQLGFFLLFAGGIPAIDSESVHKHRNVKWSCIHFPQIYAGSAAGPAPLGSAYFGTANDIHYRNPYSEQYSLSVDHEFASGYGVRLSYIGMETHDLIWAPNLNELTIFNHGFCIQSASQCTSIS